MTTFITKLDGTGTGPRLAVKDLIDVAGVPTTAGSRAVERSASPAAADAACLAGARAADARIVGKANLHELAMAPLGTNPWFGSPVNPLDARLVPGGSSSGSAVAVATEEADVAYGSDTGGSVRIPSACCGTVGLKTTHGRVSLEGVWPLAPSLDTVGPMATTVAGTVLGMQLLEPGFTPAPTSAQRIGRLRTTGDPRIEAAIDDALRRAELEVVTVDWDGWELAERVFMHVFFAEAWQSDHHLLDDSPDDLGEDIRQMLGMAPMFRDGLADAQAQRPRWRQSLLDLFGQVELLALPTLPIFPPTIEAVSGDGFLQAITDLARHVAPFNPAGVPCTAQPVAAEGSAQPASLQLVGPPDGEELLVATAARIEAALA